MLEKTLESPLDCKEIQPVHPKGKQSCWSWNSNTFATWCEELTYLKRPWCWERLRAGGEGDNRGWDGWMTSLTQWTWVWVNSGSWWWTGRLGVLQSMGSQRVGHDWVTELNVSNMVLLVLFMIHDFEFHKQPVKRAGQVLLRKWWWIKDGCKFFVASLGDDFFSFTWTWVGPMILNQDSVAKLPISQPCL